MRECDTELQREPSDRTSSSSGFTGPGSDPQEALQSSGARPYVCTKVKAPKKGVRPKVTFVTLGNG